VLGCGTGSGSRPQPGETILFAAVGDSGTGRKPQFQVAAQMEAVRQSAGFDMVLMLGDNVYGSKRVTDLQSLYRLTFDEPYKPLLDAGVKFYASLGNHDALAERDYPPFNMEGRRYYSFERENVTFVALDSNAMDDDQLAWLTDTLGRATTLWKIVFLHHPLYSSARTHGSDVPLRRQLEPILVRHGVQVVLSGHDHVYERTTPQNGVVYFVSGAGGQLRRGNLSPKPFMAAGFDLDHSFLTFELEGGEVRFQAHSRTGFVVDSGLIPAQPQLLVRESRHTR
jgi:3',5'-cyclic AMP phosphodiesterase CpdA